MSLNQLQMTGRGELKGKVEVAIDRLKQFEPEEGYYVAFSGGKDSQCVYHLCQMAGVKFDAHYAVTTVDPPELVYFIREHYPDAWGGRVQQYYPDGRQITMWSLIAEHTIPPTRKARYCCAALKEPGGAGRIVVTGVRWAESPRRAESHSVVDISGKKKTTQKKAQALGVSYRINHFGDLVMNDDNDEARRMVESCYRTQKTMVNPIIDWSEDDVWEFLNDVAKVPHCCLYDEGFSRLGCICCPLGGAKNMIRDLTRWPKYRELYIRALQKMVDNHPDQIKILKKTNTRTPRTRNWWSCAGVGKLDCCLPSGFNSCSRQSAPRRSAGCSKIYALADGGDGDSGDMDMGAGTDHGASGMHILLNRGSRADQQPDSPSEGALRDRDRQRELRDYAEAWLKWWTGFGL